MSNYTGNLAIDKALWQWPRILESFGIDASYLKNKHGPCPVCGGKNRFRFDNKDGRGTFFCNQCGAGDGIALLQRYHGWDFVTAIGQLSSALGVAIKPSSYAGTPRHIGDILPEVISGIGAKQSDATVMDYRRRRLEEIWHAAHPVTIGDSVDRYLQARGIKLTDFPSVLRFHQALPYYDDRRFIGKFPALVGLVQDVTGHGVTVHRTYLGDGCKADVAKPKKLMSSVIPGASSGAAIKLYEPAEGKLALAEGIETAFAIHIATQLPVWATISANGMERVILPPHVTEVTIAIDNDVSGRGQEAGAKLAKRLLSEGRRVKRVMPNKPGYDFADLLLGICQ